MRVCYFCKIYYTKKVIDIHSAIISDFLIEATGIRIALNKMLGLKRFLIL